MSNPWFRLYSEFATDPKVQMLSEADQRRFIMLLCVRCGNDNETFHDEEIAFQLRISNDEWASTKAVFMAKNLVDEDNNPTAWDKRQYLSDSSTERVRKHREKKKQPCNVSVTPPEADTDTDTEVNHSVEREVVNGERGGQKIPPPTRKGLVCGLLRKAGMQDAAPHFLTDEAWEQILAKRTDEEIVELAMSKMAMNTGKRIGLKYIAPALLEDPQRIDANARASPIGRRKTLTETRAETYAALTGRPQNPPKESSHAPANTIDGTAQRIAS